MSVAPALQRTPLVIAAGNLVAGPVHATFRDGDRESLLHSYLVLIRQLRGQQREPSITLRGEDISALAEHLGASEDRILHDLLDRMGATRAQRKALVALFAAGLLTIVATGSVALDLAPAGVLAQGSSAVEGTVGVVELPASAIESVVELPASAIESVVELSDATPAPAVAPTGSIIEPELEIAVGGAEWEYMVSLHQLAHALATEPLTDAEIDAEIGAEGVGVADDGSVVAVAPAPVPQAEGVGVADDGSVVAVAPPPVP